MVYVYDIIFKALLDDYNNFAEEAKASYHDIHEDNLYIIRILFVSRVYSRSSQKISEFSCFVVAAPHARKG